MVRRLMRVRFGPIELPTSSNADAEGADEDAAIELSHSRRERSAIRGG